MTDEHHRHDTLLQIASGEMSKLGDCPLGISETELSPHIGDKCAHGVR